MKQCAAGLMPGNSSPVCGMSWDVVGKKSSFSLPSILKNELNIGKRAVSVLYYKSVADPWKLKRVWFLFI